MAVLPYVSLDAEAGTPSANYTLTASSAGALAITPENNWVNDPINVAGAVTITGVDISLGITHASPADLSVWIANPAGAWVNIPWAPWGGARQTFSLNNFNGLSSAGNWRLWMVDGVVNGVTGKEDLCTLTISYSLGSNMVVPAVGATVSGSFIVSVSATSAASCRLFVDDQWVSDLTYNNGNSRWEYNLDTRAFPDGAHTLVAVARDVQGNEVADGHAVAFDNWNIYCSFNSPAWGATISGWTSITALVPDYSTRGELYVDNDLVGVDTTVSGGQYGIWLYTNNYPDGNCNLRWIAYDPDGKAAAATEPVSVDNYAMTCTVSSPASGSTVVGSITVAATVPAYAARGDLYLDGVFTGQDTTLSGGQFTYTLDTRGYPDGIHVITVQAFDPDGNSGVGASSVTFNNYNIVPTITQPGTGLPISGSPTFRVETQSYAVRGELYVDGSLYAVRTTLLNSGAVYYYQFTLNTRDFRDGTHRVGAMVYDTWGDSGAQTLTYTFDNYNVFVAFTAPGSGATVSGSVAVNANVPAYAARGELYLDDNLVDVDTSVSGGQFSYALDTQNFRDGNHNLKIIAYDPDGNAAAAVRPVVFDNWQISVRITAPLDGATIRASAAITAQVPAYATRGELYVDGDLIDTLTTITAGSFAFTLNTKNFHDGTHTVTVIAYDTDGTTAADGIGVSVDNYQIFCDLWWPTTGAAVSGSITSWLYVPDFSVLGELYIDGALVGTTTTLQFVGGGFGYFGLSVATTSFSDGPHTFSGRAYDPDGNFAGDSTRPLIDNYQVYAGIASPTEGQSVSGTVTVRVNVPSYASRCELYVDGSLVNTTSTQSGGQFAPTFNSLSFPDGKHVVSVRVFDPDGNVASDARGVTIDNYNIAVTFVSPLNGFSISSTYAVVATVPPYSVRGELYVDDALLSVGGAPNAQNQYRFSLDTTRYPDGSHRLMVRAYDPDGGSGAASLSGVFDNYQISAAFVTPVAGGTVSGAAAPATVSVPSYAVKGELCVDGTLVATRTVVSGGLFSFTFDSRSFPDGYHVLGATVYDPDMNTAADSRSVLVDNYQIFCTLQAPSFGATISGRSYTVRATVPAYAVLGELLIDGMSYGTTSTMVSGEFRFSLDTTAFPDGPHAVTVIASDPDGGSASSTVSATFDNYQISVIMYTNPGGAALTGTVQVYAIVPAYAVKGELYVNDALFGMDSTRDASSQYQIGLDTTRFPDGTYRLKWMVYDPDGNAAVSTLNVRFNNYNLSSIAFNGLPSTILGSSQLIRLSVPAFAARGELYLDGTMVGTDTTISAGNFDFAVNTFAFHDGQHTIMARAYDPYQNYASVTASVAVDNYNIFCTLVAPATGGTMTGTYTVRAGVPDYASRGELYIDGALRGTTRTRTAGEFRFSLDTLTLRDGSHSVVVVATDPEGGSASASATALVDNYNISASLTFSPGGARLSGTQQLLGYTQSYAAKGEFYIDGTLAATDYSLTRSGSLYYFDASVDTTKLKDGFHVFRVVVFDPDGNGAAAQSTFEVDNWQIYSTLSSPAANSMRSGTVAVNASVPQYARRGELYVDGTLVTLTTTITSGMYRFSLDSRTIADGWHSVGVRAYDPDGESAFSSVSVLLDNTAPLLWNVTVLYPAGQSAAKKGDYISVAVQSLDTGQGSGLSSVWLNATNLGDGNNEMLDDGLHNDSSSLDGVFGSGGVKVDATMGLHFAFITATDKAGNAATGSVKVAFDTHNPLITTSYCIYPVGQTAAKQRDELRIVSHVIDTKMTVDTVLVLDTSGSMAGNPIRDARNAAKTFVGMMGENDRAAVYSFHGPNQNQPRQEIAFTSNKNSLNSTIDGLTSGDWTPLYDTVYAAIQYAKTSPNMPVVIVLTDGNDVIGYDNFGNELHSSHPLADCKFASIPVYTIGLDPGSAYPAVNETVLKEIAQTSDGGSYYHAPSSSQLQQIYEDLARVVEKMDVGGIVLVYVDASSVGGPSYTAMYDDGGHDDLSVGDGYFGSGYITVGSSSTAVIGVTTTAEDVAGNKDTDTASVRLDNTAPTLSNLLASYRPGQWWAADGDRVHFVAQVTDTGAVSGLNYVELDAASVGGPAAMRLVDDGTGNDERAYDGNWTSADVVVATGSATRFFTFKVTGWDNASNSGVQSGNIYIDNGRPLSMNITSPAPGQYVEGLLTMRVQATDKPAILEINLTLLPPDRSYQTSYNGLTGYYEYLIDTNALSDGTYFLTASGRDIAGRSIPSPSVVTFNIDNHAPALKLGSPKGGDYVSGPVTVDTAGTTDVFLLSVEYNVDSAGWVATSTAWDTTRVPDGQHTIEVRAQDRAGHVSQQTVRVTVDNTNPTCRIVNPGDGDILEGRVTISVKASDVVGIARVDLSGDVSAEAEYNPLSGYYEYSLDTRELEDGAYTFGASARDDSGRVTSSAAVGFRVDNHVPTLNVLSPAPYDYVAGLVPVQLVSSDGPFTDGLQVEYKVDEQSWTALCQTGAMWNGLWDSLAHADGSHTLTLRSIDIIGNAAQTTVQLTVDNHSPRCQVYSPLPGQYIEGKQLFQVLATDEVGIVNLTLSIPGVNDFLMSYNGYTGYYEYSLMTTGYPDGDYNATVRALDRSGRLTTVGPMVFHIDNIAPSFVLVRPQEGDSVADEISVEVAWTGGRSAPAEAKVTYRIDQGAWIPAEENTSVSSIADGSHTITVRAEDPAGHTTDVSVHIFVDKGWPDVAVLSPKSGVHTGSSVDLRLRARDAAGIGSVTVARGNGTPEEIYLNGATGFYEYGLDLAGLPDSPYNFSVTARDLFGHETVSNLTVVLDTTGPELVQRSPSSGGDKKGQVKFSVGATDVSGVASVSIRLRSGDWRDMRLDALGNYVYTWDTSVGDDGRRVIEVRATDKLGNEAFATVDLSVKNYQSNWAVENFNWLLLLVLIAGFVAVTVSVLRRPRLPPQYLEALRLAAASPRPAAAPPPVPPASRPPAPVPAPAPAKDQTSFEESEDAFFDEAPSKAPAEKLAAAAPAPAPAGKAGPPEKTGFSLWGRKAEPAAPRGGTGASLAAALGKPPGPPAPSLKTIPPPEETGFEEVVEDDLVEEVKMEQAWMPSHSLPPAQEMPRPLRTQGTGGVPPGAGFGARPAAPPAPPAGDVWEEEEEEAFFEESPAPPKAPPVPLQPQAPAAGSRPMGGQAMSPLDLASLGLNLKVTRSEDERKRKGPPPGWYHPRPAELPPEAPPPAPKAPSKPRASEGVVAPPSAVKSVPAGAQKMTPKDREKMGVMLDDLLTKSRKK